MSEVHLRKLVKRHRRAESAAVDGVDLVMPAGSLTTLVGPSGCGKSTLLALIAGLAVPDAGDILIAGQSVLKRPPERRGAVLMEQDPALFPHMTIAENVGFALRMRGVARTEAARRVASLLDLVRLGEFGSRRPDGISGGQAQRVALARALAAEPAVLLLDEPFTALDPDLRDEMRGLVRTIQARTKTTMLLVTHDRLEAVAMADRLAVMLAGRIVQADAPEVVYDHPATAAAARFLGFTNTLAGAVRGWRFETGEGHLGLDQAALDGPSRAVFRPEATTLTTDGSGLAGTVVAVAYLGERSAVTVAVGEATVVAHVDPAVGARVAPGSPVRVAAAADRIRVFPVTA